MDITHKIIKERESNDTIMECPRCLKFNEWHLSYIPQKGNLLFCGNCKLALVPPPGEDIHKGRERMVIQSEAVNGIRLLTKADQAELYDQFLGQTTLLQKLARNRSELACTTLLPSLVATISKLTRNRVKAIGVAAVQDVDSREYLI